MARSIDGACTFNEEVRDPAAAPGPEPDLESPIFNPPSCGAGAHDALGSEAFADNVRLFDYGARPPDRD